MPRGRRNRRVPAHGRLKEPGDALGPDFARKSLHHRVEIAEADRVALRVFHRGVDPVGLHRSGPVCAMRDALGSQPRIARLPLVQGRPVVTRHRRDQPVDDRALSRLDAQEGRRAQGRVAPDPAPAGQLRGLGQGSARVWRGSQGCHSRKPPRSVSSSACRLSVTDRRFCCKPLAGSRGTGYRKGDRIGKIRFGERPDRCRRSNRPGKLSGKRTLPAVDSGE